MMKYLLSGTAAATLCTFVAALLCIAVLLSGCTNVAVPAGMPGPCTANSTSCCDPSASPVQLCPGGLRCLPCGGSVACECPSHKRLTIINGCPTKPIWIAHIAAGKVGPDLQDVKIAGGEKYEFTTAVDGAGLPATRYWPKMGCNASGSDCEIGNSGGPGEACVIRIPGKADNYDECAPPFDSKFEATFEKPNYAQCAPSQAGCAPPLDTVDMSLVDGWTLPFKLEVSGSCTRQGHSFTSLDCSGVSSQQCPRAEVLDGKATDLRAVDSKNKKFVGCFSPCNRLLHDKWSTPGGTEVESYCCSGAYGTPETCQAGPILSTQYLRAVHESCPAGYGYAYDDKSATIVCDTSTHYTVTFYCPTAEESEPFVVYFA